MRSQAEGKYSFTVIYAGKPLTTVRAELAEIREEGTLILRGTDSEVVFAAAPGRWHNVVKKD